MDLLVDSLKTIMAVLGALVLAIFAKRYSDLKKRDAELRTREAQDEKENIINENAITSYDDLLERENEYLRPRKPK